MKKPIIFISHINEESNIANHLKDFIDRKFLKSVDVFVSSHEESLKLGDDWLSVIKSSLSECILLVVICSPLSVGRPWINFEAGAGWVNKIPVVPLCHSGLQPGDLSVPLNSFQAGTLNKKEDIGKLFKRISQLINITTPDIQDDDFFDISSKFEHGIKSSILIKDTTFIYNLLYKNIVLLKFSICASVFDYDEIQTTDFQNNNLSFLTISFNNIYNLHNISLLNLSGSERIYQVFYNTVYSLGENIKFLFSYNNLKLSPELKDLLENFLFSTFIVDEWINSIKMVDNQPKDKNIKEMLINMVKEEPLPPQKRTSSNLINYYMDYYNSLNIFKDWTIKYDKIMVNLLNRQ
ncbi:MAG: toll/interleukin-1 receptor domain-containing protein [Pseudomonadota bacterium]